jgi:hypothetical protein
MTVSKTISPKKSRTSASTSAVSSSAASCIVSTMPLKDSRPGRSAITSRITSIICVSPSSAKYSHWIGISTSVAPASAVRVSSPTEGGQSIRQ